MFPRERLMHLNIFLKGLIIGILVNAPLGPIGWLCVQRTLSKGKLYGLVSGFGAATADAIYSFIPAFGLTLLSSFLVEHQAWFRPIGGIFLCGLGVKAFFSRSEKTPVAEIKISYFGAYISTLFLTLVNPLLILVFTAIFAGLSIVNSSADYSASTILVLGIFIGSGLWWLVLSSITATFREKLSSGIVLWMKKISGLAIVAFGILVLVSG
jgi:threonine/homoserine/homoserine lactone efflux protein